MLRMKFFNMSITLFITVLFMFVNTLPAAQQEPEWLDKPVTVRFQNESLSKVLSEVSKQTGITISYDQELANEKVTGNFIDVKVFAVISRLFSSKNKSIQVNKNKKIIIVKTFGAKKFIWAGAGEGSEKSILVGHPPPLGKDIRGGMVIDQKAVVTKRVIGDPNAVEPLTGISRQEIELVAEREKASYAAYLNDPNAVEPLTGISRQEIELVAEREKASYAAYLNDPNAVEPLTGVSLQEIKLIHDREKAYNSSKINTKDPLSELIL